MLHRRRTLAVVIAVIATLALSTVVVLGTPGIRSAAVREAFAIALSTKSLHLAHVDLAVDAHGLDARDLVVTDKSGKAVISARDIDMTYTLSHRAFALTSVSLVDPRVVMSREPDGTYDLLDAFASKSSAQNKVPAQIDLSVRGGSFEIENGSSPAEAGRIVSLRRINVDMRARNGVMRGALTGQLEGSHAASAIHAELLQNDSTKIARAAMRIDGAPLAPVVDLLTSTRSLAVESGTADLAADLYAIGWNDAAGPSWHLVGEGAIHHACLRTLPLAVAVCGIDGPVRISDGLIFFPKLAATASGVAVGASGTLGLAPEPSIDLNVHAAAPLARMRSLLAFSRTMPLRGAAQLTAAIRGPAANPHADIKFRSAGAVAYGAVPVTALASHLYYHDGHVVVLATDVVYDGANIYASGDIDLTAAPVSGQFTSLASVPADRLPLLAQLTPHATARADASFNGPLAHLAGEGFADIRGGRTNVRLALQANQDQLAVAGIADDRRGGELFAGARIARSASGDAYSDVIARNFAVRADGPPVALPGLSRRTFALPQSRARLDGVLSLSGTRAKPIGSLAATVAQLDVGAVGGESSESISGLEKSSLRGVVNGRDWIGDISAQGRGMRIAGVGVSALHGIVVGSGFRFASGDVAARIGRGQATIVGTIQSPNAGDARIYVSDINGSALQSVGAPLSGGTLTAIGDLKIRSGRPTWSLQGALADAELAGHVVSGDGVFHYDKGTLRSDDARVSMDGTESYIAGQARGIGSAPAGAASVDANVKIPAGDLAAISTFSGNDALGVAGLASATVHVGGTIAAPVIQGNIASDIGTMRGVTFTNLHASALQSAGALSIQDAGVQFGDSTLRLSGEVWPALADLHVASQHVDLGDFNDFFNGKDVLEGHGSIALDVASGSNHVQTRGGMRLRDVRIDGVPAGAVDVAFAPYAGLTSVRVDQHNDLDAVAMKATIGTQSPGRLSFDPRSALYSLDGSIRAPDLGAIAPYVGAEDQRIGGDLTGSLHLQGTLSNLEGAGTFALAHARIRDVAFDRVSAQLRADREGYEVRSLRATNQSMTVDARGRLTRSTGAIAASARADIHDLAAAARLAHLPGTTRGSAIVEVTAAGTVAQPVLTARASANRAQVQDFSFENATFAASYARGRLGARGAVALARDGGSVDAAGSLPVQLRPFRIGPNRAPVALRANFANVEIGAIDPLLGNAATMHGRLSGAVSVAGNVGEPAVAGNAQLRGATIASRYDRTGAHDVNVDLTFSGDTISMRDLQARLGGGTLAAHGEAHIVPATRMHPAPNLQFAMRAALDNAQFDVPALAQGKVSGDLSLTKSGRIPYLEGNVVLNDTSMPFASIIALASNGNSRQPSADLPGVPKPLPGRVVGYAGSIYGGGFKLETPPMPHLHRHLLIPHRIDLGLQVTAAKNVGITGAISASGSGTIDVGGTTRTPKLNGTLTALRGRAGFLNTRFDLNYGAVTFNPGDGLLPTIDADATTSTDTADITVTISGRVDQLHTAFASNPDMPSDAIAASLLHIPQINSALASSHGIDQSQFGVAPQDVVTGAIASEVLGALNSGLEQLFNVGDVNFQIDANGNPGVEFRQPFGPHAYTVYKSTFSVPPAQSFGVAYVVRQALQVEFTQSQSTPGASPIAAPPLTSLEVQISFH
jgi:autotransporter translocation and assembly factor TamB